MIAYKLIIIAICSALNIWGGYSWHNARRFIMPLVIGGAFSFFSNCWWLGFTVLPVAAWLCVGYGEKSVMRKYMSDQACRAVWLFMAAFIIGIGAVLTGHLSLIAYIPYIIIAGLLGALLENINQIIGDFIFGAYLSSIVLLIK